MIGTSSSTSSTTASIEVVPVPGNDATIEYNLQTLELGGTSQSTSGTSGSLNVVPVPNNTADIEYNIRDTSVSGSSSSTSAASGSLNIVPVPGNDATIEYNLQTLELSGTSQSTSGTSGSLNVVPVPGTTNTLEYNVEIDYVLPIDEITEAETITVSPEITEVTTLYTNALTWLEQGTVEYVEVAVTQDNVNEPTEWTVIENGDPLPVARGSDLTGYYIWLRTTTTNIEARIYDITFKASTTLPITGANSDLQEETMLDESIATGDIEEGTTTYRVDLNPHEIGGSIQVRVATSSDLVGSVVPVGSNESVIVGTINVIENESEEIDVEYWVRTKLPKNKGKGLPRR